MVNGIVCCVALLYLLSSFPLKCCNAFTLELVRSFIVT